MESHLSFHEIPLGVAKLCMDISTLVNNRQGSDIQFKVGGGISVQENGEIVYDESATVTLYAHSLILCCRSSYFASMLDEERNWKESSKGVIYKPNISPSTFLDVLHYIYTGNIRVKNSESIMELIAAADEMGLEELSVGCQNELIRTANYIFSDKNNESTKRHIPIDISLHTHIIPALNLASSHYLSHLSQKLTTIILPHISVIVKSPDTYATFIDGISSDALIKFIESDNLAMTERTIWDLALDWACHQTKLPKNAVESRLRNLGYDKGYDEELSDKVLINDIQLYQLREILEPLLPSIRFSLLGSDDFKHLVNILNYFVPRRRYLEINQFFANPDCMELLDTPREKVTLQKILSKIVVESATLKFLKTCIFEKGGIAGCHSLNDLKFELLFRASEHGFLGSTFHRHCDNKGPTLVIVRSADGHIFGGVNFNDWKSERPFSSSGLNFLFALSNGYHRNDSVIFGIKNQTKIEHSSWSQPDLGPCFGQGDLVILNSANTTQDSFSNLPRSYDGNGASNTALAGARNFAVSDYEVFAISK